jgi:hypothetical protein
MANMGTPAVKTPSAEQPVNAPTGPAEDATEVASLSAQAANATFDESSFVTLPGAMAASEEEGGEIVRVRMARGELTAFGLPVDAQRADDVISVDFLVGEDGMPRAVRLAD